LSRRLSYFCPPERNCCKEKLLLDVFLKGLNFANSLNDLNGLNFLNALKGSNFAKTGIVCLL
jgi:hypothetical protein